LTLRVVKSGILTTLQGLGRQGYARFGVNPGGAMDKAAVRLLNVLLGNGEGDAAVEMHFPAASFEVESDCAAAVGGADFDARVNDVPVRMWKPFRLSAGDRITFGEKSSGSWVYLSAAGGFVADEWLGSKSTSLSTGFGGIGGRALLPGDLLRTRAVADAPISRYISRRLIPTYSSYPTLRILKGPEFDLLDASGRESLGNSEFLITPESNRMGFRLSGPRLRLQSAVELVSSPVTFGTLQLLPSGQLILLMADHQTTGGYPRVANVIGFDLPVAAQVPAGNKVGFRIVEIEEAERLTAEFERDVAFLRVGSTYRPG
jgi:antagonist of KipI